MSGIIAADPSPRTYRQTARFLSGLDEDWARHIAAVGPCRHAAKPAREPYEALVRAIAYQPGICGDFPIVEVHPQEPEFLRMNLLLCWPCD